MSENSTVLPFDALLARFDGDLDLLVDVIELFTVEHVKQIAAVRRAVESRNASDLELAAHTIKGTVATFGADEARDVAHALEKLGREADLRNSLPLVDDLDRLVSAVARELGEIAASKG